MVLHSHLSGKGHTLRNTKDVTGGTSGVYRHAIMEIDGNDKNGIPVSTILGLANDFKKGNDIKGVNIEIYSDAKSIDSTGSVISLESIQSATIQSDTSEEYLKNERWYTVLLQISIPFIIAGMGTIGAGLILGTTENYEVFKEVESLYILVPAIIGLKGNLDMCLASRLSTQANLGNIHWDGEMFKMILGNIGLVQVQAIVAAIVVSVYAVCISSLLTGRPIILGFALLLTCSSVLTATISCFILDIFLSSIIVLAHRVNINPDNLATPLAASIGDMLSLTFLSIFANVLYTVPEHMYWCFYVILVIYLFILLPTWVMLVKKNQYTRDVLMRGWIPVLSALFISGCSGLMLERAVSQYRGFTIFQPIANGVGGNLVSVQASRISTMLHKSSLPGILPPHTKQWVWPWTALFSGVLPAKTARILIIICIPGQAIFVYLADLIYNEGISTITLPFVFTYLTIVVFQVMILLYIAHIITHSMWKFKVDPDNCAIPYLTALGDFLGSGFLLVAFIFLSSIGYEYEPVV